VRFEVKFTNKMFVERGLIGGDYHTLWKKVNDMKN
jgi:hypothetical protein